MSWNFKDLTGQKFGRLTVLERAENSKDRRTQWLCQCDCGIKCVVKGKYLLNGDTKSCGCFHAESAAQRFTTHGLRHEKTYRIWKAIKERCFKPKCKNYEYYGARGITLYEPWINDAAAFYEYVSKLEHFGEKGYSLDRINNDGNYEPGNLRYATRTEQNRNTRHNVIVEYQGEKMCLTEAAEKCGVSPCTLKARIKHGDRGDFLFRPVEK